ncbi:MAG: imidazole glycerol phosphate synthase subunit HisF [Candidatus Marinimicrobia bacterium]|nr:imidazole glycerol phosphate synthase subunit HisF [Candidatus Neomarinimicrobiota bacterium]|tara:strand:+ start:43683 stop:44447 length:765 start_codon:yes stop_codon:yes gene_type:complete
MYRPRVIPILLLENNGIVKTIRFNKSNYIGDPINAVKIFNDLKADELVFLDILATKEKRSISKNLIQKVADEANMPFSVGGGIKSLTDIKEIINLGAEKVIINSHAIENPNFIKEASDSFGSSTIVVSIDVKKSFLGKRYIYKKSSKKSMKICPVEFSKLVEENGAGEILINSVDNDGTMKGYDFDLISQVSTNVSIPVVAAGGAGNYEDFTMAIKYSYASAVAAGSMFVYHGPHNAVLLNYPSKDEIIEIFNK